MELDQLLDLCSVVCNKALPIVLFILLIFLIIFTKHLIDILKSAKQSLNKVDNVLDVAYQELVSLEKPLNTLNELSDTVDQVHEASKHAVRSSLVLVIENLGKIKEVISNILHKKDIDIDSILDDLDEEERGDINE